MIIPIGNTIMADHNAMPKRTFIIIIITDRVSYVKVVLALHSAKVIFGTKRPPNTANEENLLFLRNRIKMDLTSFFTYYILVFDLER